VTLMFTKKTLLYMYTIQPTFVPTSLKSAFLAYLQLRRDSKHLYELLHCVIFVSAPYELQGCNKGPLLAWIFKSVPK